MIIFKFIVHTIICNHLKEEFKMNCNKNQAIKCTVQQCAHHCGNENYCSLDSILVGTHELNPTMDQCTDCKSFQLKK